MQILLDTLNDAQMSVYRIHKLRLYLMQLEAHSNCRSHYLLQEVQISKNPLVFGGDAEVAFKQGVETVQK